MSHGFPMVVTCNCLKQKTALHGLAFQSKRKGQRSSTGVRGLSTGDGARWKGLGRWSVGRGIGLLRQNRRDFKWGEACADG